MSSSAFEDQSAVQVLQRAVEVAAMNLQDEVAWTKDV